MFKLVVLIISCIGIAQSSVVNKAKINEILKNVDVGLTGEQIKADASEFVDLLMENLREAMVAIGLDNIPLPEAREGFEEKWGGIIWHGEAKLYDGSLKGLETLKRTGVADISLDPNGDIVVTCETGVFNANLGYKMHVTFMHLGPRADVRGTLTNLKVMLVLRVGSDLSVQLDRFFIKSTGVMTAEVIGLGEFFNGIIQTILVVVGNLVKQVVAVMISGPIRDLINMLLTNLLFPPSAVEGVQVLQNFASTHADFFA